MTEPASYLTVARPARVDTEVRRSRFLCRVERVTSEAEARAVVEEERRSHWDARHHCSAFVLGPAGDVQRSNDDGEPSGTAGAPMLEVLRGRAVSDVVAVVTRYFGGVLLGAGGLVRAYSDAVRAGLDEAGTLERRLLELHDVVVPHAEAGRLEHALRSRDITVLGVDYAERATLHAATPAGMAADLHAVLAEVSGGSPCTTFVGLRWVDGPQRPTAP